MPLVSPVDGGGKETQGFGVITLEKSAELAAIAVAAAARAEIESAYIVAMKNRREEETARTKINRVSMNLIFAKKALYCKPVGGTKIIGPSIRFAEEMLRLWGNCKVTQTAIYEDSSRRIVKIVVRDLETNMSYDKDVTIEKKVERKSAYGRDVLSERINTKKERVFIVVATEDEVLIKESALASKAIRNSGLRLIPQHIIEEALSIVRQTIRGGVDKDPETAKRAIVDAFASKGIFAGDIEKFLKHPLAQITTDEIAELQNILNSISEGQTRWGDYVNGDKKTAEKAEPAKGSLDGLSAGDASKATNVKEPLKEQGAGGNLATKTQIEAIKKLAKKDAGLKKKVNDFFLTYDKADYSELTEKEAAEILRGLQE